MNESELIDRLILMYQPKSFPQPKRDVYLQVIGNWKLKAEQMRRLFLEVVAVLRFFPSLAELNEVRQALFPAPAKLEFTGEKFECYAGPNGENHARYTPEYREFLKSCGR